MITFVVQNETHAMNFAPVVGELLKRGVPENRLQTLHLDPIFGMTTLNLIEVPNQRIVQVAIPSPYYRLGRWERFRWLMKSAHTLAESVKDTTVLVIGSDGGIQRLLSNRTRAHGGKAVMLLDGLLHPWPKGSVIKHRAKRTLGKALARVGLNYLFPSDVGHSNLDLIFVMNSFVKSLLMSQGVDIPIEVVSLPRFNGYLERFNELRSAGHSQGRNNLLYVTGAYKWHGLYRESRCQERDIADLIEFAHAHPELTIRIRIHPREVMEDYLRDWPSNIEISDSNRPVLEDLAWASVVITARSTVALEAEMVGVPTIIYTRNFGSPGHESYFGQDEYFLKSPNLSDALGVVLSDSNSQVSGSWTSDVPKIADRLLDIWTNARENK